MQAKPAWVATLPFTPPYSWDSILAYQALRAIPGVEAVSATTYRRSVMIGGAAAIMEARAGGGGALDFERLGGLDEAIERLCALPGIGPWTAHYIAMRGLGMSDAFPPPAILASSARRRRTAGGSAPGN